MSEISGPGPDELGFTHGTPPGLGAEGESPQGRVTGGEAYELPPIPEHLTPHEAQPIARADMERAAAAMRDHPEITRQRGMEFAASYQNHTVPTRHGWLSYRCSPTGEEVKIHTLSQETMGHGRGAAARMKALAGGTVAEHEGTEITYRSDLPLITVQTGAEYPHPNLKSSHVQYIRTVVDSAMPMIAADEVTREDLQE